MNKEIKKSIKKWMKEWMNEWWMWMNVNECELLWMWMNVNECEWMWLNVNECEWMWMNDVCGWMWILRRPNSYKRVYWIKFTRSFTRNGCPVVERPVSILEWAPWAPRGMSAAGRRRAIGGRPSPTLLGVIVRRIFRTCPHVITSWSTDI